MHRIWLIQIRPEPDLANFRTEIQLEPGPYLVKQITYNIKGKVDVNVDWLCGSIVVFMFNDHIYYVAYVFMAISLRCWSIHMHLLTVCSFGYSYYSIVNHQENVRQLLCWEFFNPANLAINAAGSRFDQICWKQPDSVPAGAEIRHVPTYFHFFWISSAFM